MTLQSISKTLSYYLSEDSSGLEEFKNWANNCKFIYPITFKITLCCINLEQTKWLQKNKRQIIFQEIKTILSGYVKNICGKEPIEYFLEFIAEIDKYCYQGIYGYQVSYITGTDKHCPHYWMIKPEDYKNIQIIQDIYNLELIKLCVIICDLYIIIDDKPTHIQWSN
jgi:hypothetical protein